MAPGSTAAAQGLPGYAGAPHYGGPAPLIMGESDKDRWNRLLSIQPSLIGMKLSEVEKRLGPGKPYRSESELYYRITDSKLIIPKNLLENPFHCQSPRMNIIEFELRIHQGS